MFDNISGKWLCRFVTAACASGFLLFGFDQGVMSGLLTGRAFTKQFPSIDTTYRNGNSSLQGLVVAIYEIGCFLGAFATFLFGENFGRRTCIIGGCSILIVGAILQASSFSLAQMIVGRIVAGVGNGINSSTLPIWNSESVPAKSRGVHVTFELFITICGVAVAYWIDYGLSYTNTDIQWRFPLAFQIFFALLTIALTVILPESPRWLISHDHMEEAKIVLFRLMKSEKIKSMNDDRVLAEVKIVLDTILHERSLAENSFKAVFARNKARNLRRTLLSIGAQIMQQLTGINLVTYYAPVVLQNSLNLSHHLSLLLGGIMGIAYVLSVIPALFLVDRAGRRPTMLFSCGGICLCMIVLAGTLSHQHVNGTGIAAVVMLFLINFFFANGMLAQPWLLPTEYAPLQIRTKVCALATMADWIFNFLIVEITPPSVANIGYKTYIYFAIFNFCSFLIIYFFYPEVSGLSLEEIDIIFMAEKVPLNWKKQGMEIITDNRLKPESETEHIEKSSSVV